MVWPSPSGAAPYWPVVGPAASAVEVMAAIPVATAVAGSKVTLMIPPALATVEERGEIGLPASPSGGTHSSPSWSKLEVSGGDVARPEA